MTIAAYTMDPCLDCTMSEEEGLVAYHSKVDWGGGGGG